MLNIASVSYLTSSTKLFRTLIKPDSSVKTRRWRRTEIRSLLWDPPVPEPSPLAQFYLVGLIQARCLLNRFGQSEPVGTQVIFLVGPISILTLLKFKPHVQAASLT